MSSATSTEPRPLAPDTAGARGDDPALQPWQLFTLAGLIGATVIVFVSRDQSPAGTILLSLTAFTAAILGVAAWRMLAPLTREGEAFGSRVLGGRGRAALEREKTLVLRSIKELEFDRAMGKLSERDFAEMSGRLRGRAGRLLRQLDAGTGYREQIEKEIARLVGDATSPATHAVARGVSVRPDLPGKAGMVRPVDAVDVSKACPSCGTNNDPDARFCKNCGTRVETIA